MAITEDENEISLRDANSSRERPRLDGFDMDEDTVSEIEVNHISYLTLVYSNTKKNSLLTLMLPDLWTSSLTLSILRKRSSLEKTSLMPLMLLISVDSYHCRTLSLWAAHLNLRL